MLLLLPVKLRSCQKLEEEAGESSSYVGRLEKKLIEKEDEACHLFIALCSVFAPGMKVDSWV